MTITMNVILLYDNHRHVSPTRGHLQGGENKNTNTIVIYQNHSTVKDHIVFFLNSQLNSKMSMSI